MQYHEEFLKASLMPVLGLLMWWAAGRLRWPVVPMLLATGILLREMGLPSPLEVARPAVLVMVQLGLIVVFFEGGRSLQRTSLEGVRHEVQHLVAIGPKLGWLLASFAAMLILGVPLETGLLVGAALMVAAPYAVDGLHARLHGSEPSYRLLLWDAYLVSCLGAAWTALTYSAIIAHLGHPNLVATLKFTAQAAVAGCLFGFLAARLLAFVRSHLPTELEGPAAFATAMLTFAVAQALVMGSGILAAGVAGFVVSRQRGESTVDPFARDLRTLLLASLGVLMGTVVPLEQVFHEWPRRLAFAVFMVVVARPLLVAIALRKSSLPWPDKVVLAAVNPRGALCLSVCIFVSVALTHHGHPELAREMPAIVWWVVMVSNLLAALAAPWLTRQVPRGDVFKSAPSCSSDSSSP